MQPMRYSTMSPKAWCSQAKAFMEWIIHGAPFQSGYGVDMEKIFENEMKWSGFGLQLITWSGFGAKILHREDLYSPVSTVRAKASASLHLNNLVQKTFYHPYTAKVSKLLLFYRFRCVIGLFHISDYLFDFRIHLTVVLYISGVPVGHSVVPVLP